MAYSMYFTGTTRIYRLLPEQIKQASDEPLVPVAVYNKDDAIYEIESLAISDSGTLYIAQNCDSEFTKDDAVTQIGALSLLANRSLICNNQPPYAPKHIAADFTGIFYQYTILLE